MYPNKRQQPFYDRNFYPGPHKPNDRNLKDITSNFENRQSRRNDRLYTPYDRSERQLKSKRNSKSKRHIYIGKENNGRDDKSYRPKPSRWSPPSPEPQAPPRYPDYDYSVGYYSQEYLDRANYLMREHCNLKKPMDYVDFYSTDGQSFLKYLKRVHKQEPHVPACEEDAQINLYRYILKALVSVKEAVKTVEVDKQDRVTTGNVVNYHGRAYELDDETSTAVAKLYCPDRRIYEDDYTAVSSGWYEPW